MGVDHGIEFRVVIHLHLAVEFEAAFAGEDVGPERIEAGGQVAALLFEQGQAAEVFLAVGLGGGGAVGLLGGVVDLEGQDGEAVDDEAGRLGVEGCGGVLGCRRRRAAARSMDSTRSLRVWLRVSMLCLTWAMQASEAPGSRALSSSCQRSKLARCWAR